MSMSCGVGIDSGNVCVICRYTVYTERPVSKARRTPQRRVLLACLPPAPPHASPRTRPPARSRAFARSCTCPHARRPPAPRPPPVHPRPLVTGCGEARTRPHHLVTLVDHNARERMPPTGGKCALSAARLPIALRHPLLPHCHRRHHPKLSCAQHEQTSNRSRPNKTCTTRTNKSDYDRSSGHKPCRQLTSITPPACA